MVYSQPYSNFGQSLVYGGFDEMRTYYAGKGVVLARLTRVVLNRASEGNAIYLGLLSVLAIGLGFVVCHSKLKLLFIRASHEHSPFYRMTGLLFAGLSTAPFTVWMSMIKKNNPVPDFSQNLMFCCLATYGLLAIATLAAHQHGKYIDSDAGQAERSADFFNQQD